MSDRLALTLRMAVRAERARRGWSQAQLADRLGWSRQVVTSIENGRRDIALHETPDLCRALGVPLRALFVQADPDDVGALGI